MAEERRPDSDEDVIAQAAQAHFAAAEHRAHPFEAEEAASDEDTAQVQAAVDEPPVAVQEVGDDGELLVAAPPAPPVWKRLVDAVLGMPRRQRLEAITAVIEADPDAAANYVIRGELYLESREYALAAVDFERGLELVERELAAADWGIFDQMLRDRALMGLHQTRRYVE